MYNKETEMYEGYIYKITNKINGKIYIGQTTTTIIHRWKQHIIHSKHHEKYKNILYNAINYYGKESFILEEIYKNSFKDKIDLKKDLNIKEIYYINKYNSLNPNGYNLTKGGDNISERIKIPVDQYDKNGNFISTYESVSDACNAIGKDVCRVTAILKSCNGKSFNLIFGYIWRFKNEPFNRYPVVVKNQSIEVDCYSLNGNFIKRYKSIGEAIKDIGYSMDYHSHIRACCDGKKSYALGFVWRYKDEKFNKYRIINGHCKPINCYSLNDEYICTYNSSNDAGKFIKNDNKFHARANCIRSCANGKRPTMYGFKWYYANDENQPDKSKIIA